MSHTSKDHNLDAATRRRDYLCRKTAANALAGVVGCATLCFMVFAALLGVPLALMFIMFGASHGFQALPQFLFVGALILAAICGLSVLGSRLYNRLDQTARFIPYVPPVQDQIAALPADEILLRGSNQPAASKDELLRADQRIQQSTADELLRYCERAQE
jgi:hypothetical protein